MKSLNEKLILKKKQGIPITINCANYVYFLALQKCLELSPKAVEIFTGIFQSNFIE